MTKILKLEAKGFKSFANKTEFLFGDNFNVILGPNGSGKSNVLDALCFVLGKSSAKGLRAEKSSNLIYNGGKSKQPAKQGEVSIYFDNSKKEFPVDVAEVKITRIIRENGQSIYKINEEKHTREQILELLGAAQIFPDGYNIILQGDIVRLVEMSPVERRGIIEEIAGISVYEDKKQKAMNELDKIEKNLNDAEIILQERKVYLSELKKERDQAVLYKELIEKVRSLKATLVHIEIESREKSVSEINVKSGVFVEKITAIQKEIAEIKTIVVDFKKKIADINHEIEEKGEQSQIIIHKQVEMLRVDLATSTAGIDGFKNELDRIKSQRNQLEQSLNETNTKLSLTQNDIVSYTKELEDNKRLQASIVQKIADFKLKNKLDDASDVEKQIADIDAKVEALEKEIFEMRGKQQDFIREKDRLEIQIANADERITKVAQVSKESKQEVERLQELKKQFKTSTVELQKCLTNDASYAGQVSTARGKLGSIQEELAKTRVRQASLKEMIGGDMAVKSIIQNKSKFEGVFGTVAELGVVEKKYATALDVAAGNRLNSIVVSDDKVASECIKFLKNQKLGAATFLPLNKIKGGSVDSSILKTQGVVGSAIALVKFDPKYKAVFSYVFGGTVVVDNIDTARRIGIGNYKMVTLDGDIAEVSGAMRGGFIRRNSGTGFQEAKDDNEEKLEEQESDYQTLVAKLETDRKNNQDQIDRLRELKANLEGDIIRIEKSLHLDSDDLEISQKLKSEFKLKLVQVETDLTAISTVVSGKNRELATFKIDKQKMRAQIMGMKDPTKLAELTAFEQKLQSLKNDSIKLDTEIGIKKKQVESSSDVKNIKDLLISNDSEKKDIDAKVDKIKEKIVKITADLKEKEQVEKEFMAKFKLYFAERNKLMEKVDKEEAKIIKKDEELRENEHKNTTFALDLARIRAELNAYLEEFKQYEGVKLLTPSSDMRKELWAAEQKLGRIGNVNMKALEIFDKIEEEFNKLLVKKDILIDEKEKVLMMINEIESKKKDLFMTMFDVVNNNFQKVFEILSTKGEASMELENPKAPFDGGVIIKVRLTGKKFMDIRSLSGGEKTLTALAFIFAVQEHNPASFYVFDEVDAALDKRNAEKLAGLVKAYSNRAQYVVISHNDGVISAADILYGVSMDEHGITKVVSLKV
jgi:chromosome segregation protein